MDHIWTRTGHFGGSSDLAGFPTLVSGKADSEPPICRNRFKDGHDPFRGRFPDVANHRGGAAASSKVRSVTGIVAAGQRVDWSDFTSNFGLPSGSGKPDPAWNRTDLRQIHQRVNADRPRHAARGRSADPLHVRAASTPELPSACRRVSHRRRRLPPPADQLAIPVGSDCGLRPARRQATV